MDFMSKEESYADRRQLFKNIWETAMQIEEKEVDNIMAKPKVIKTLRLDDVNKSAERRKKERIRNLRTVCRKILEFCDCQDEDINNYAQDAEGQERARYRLELKKIKTHHRRKRAKKNNLLVLKSSSFEREIDFPRIIPKTTTSRYNTPPTAGKTIVQRALVTRRRTSNVKSNSDKKSNNALGKGTATATRRQVILRKSNKQETPTVQNLSSPGPSGILDSPDPA